MSARIPEEGIGEAMREETVFTPANIVTMCRILLVPVFVVAFLSPWPEWFGIPDLPDAWKSLIAAAIFVIISCTDWVDGYLARSRGEVTDFGKFMDPLADKILVAAALLALIDEQVLPSWPVLIILAREFIVSGVRMVAASKGEVIAASWYGKAKTVLQIGAIVMFLMRDIFPPLDGVDPLHAPFYLASWIVMIAALVLTIISMVDYLVKARGLLGFRTASSEPEGSFSTFDIDTAITEAAQDAVRLALEKGVTMATAESLTGGAIAAAITAVPGSSGAFRGACVTYAIDTKKELLGVDAELLSACGAVDGEVARQMASGARAELQADIAVSVTGIAGPTGAEEGKPVGTVWLGVSAQAECEAQHRLFSGDREAVRKQTVLAALEILRERLS